MFYGYALIPFVSNPFVTETLVQSTIRLFKLRAAAAGCTFEAESCITTTLNNLNTCVF